MRRALVLATAGAVALGGLAALPQTASAKRRPVKPDVTGIEPILGLQGAAGGDANVPVSFRLTSRRPQLFDVEVQFGFDRNQDGLLVEDEFRAVTEDRLDRRDTREDSPPQLYRAAPSPGRLNTFVWNTRADVGTTPLRTLEYAISTTGRLVPDPDNPGSFLFDGVVGRGVSVRVRAVRGHGRRGSWVTFGPFSLANGRPPSMTLDSFESGTPVMVHWTVFDSDSEDLNGNGQLDVQDGEDGNGNGQLDAGQCGVAFDWHRLDEGVDPAARSDAELEALAWTPCTRVAGVGDTDSLDVRSGGPVPATGDLSGLPAAAPGFGRHWFFAWDVAKDAGPGDYILRARPFDETRAVGERVYSRSVVHGGD